MVDPQPRELLVAAIDAVACRSCVADLGRPCATRTGEKLIGIHEWRLDDHLWHIAKERDTG